MAEFFQKTWKNSESSIPDKSMGLVYLPQIVCYRIFAVNLCYMQVALPMPYMNPIQIDGSNVFLLGIVYP